MSATKSFTLEVHVYEPQIPFPTLDSTTCIYSVDVSGLGRDARFTEVQKIGKAMENVVPRGKFLKVRVLDWNNLLDCEFVWDGKLDQDRLSVRAIQALHIAQNAAANLNEALQEVIKVGGNVRLTTQQSTTNGQITDAKVFVRNAVWRDGEEG